MKRKLVTLLLVLCSASCMGEITACSSGEKNEFDGLVYNSNDVYELSRLDVWACTLLDEDNKLVYTLSANKEYYIVTRKGVSENTNIVIRDNVSNIPFRDSMYEKRELPVKEIADNTFMGCDNIIGVTMGKNIISIGEHAFYECDALTSITIPENVIRIGEDAFFNCDNLKNVEFERKSGWYRKKKGDLSIEIPASDFENPSIVAEYLTTTFCEFIWMNGAI